MDVHADARLGDLSGGQRQRVALAKALAAEPELLILDEPTTGVDPVARQDFFELLDTLNHDQGLTVILVSHDLHAALHSAHRVLVVSRRIAFDGPASHMSEAEIHAHAFPVDLGHRHPQEGDRPGAARP